MSEYQEALSRLNMPERTPGISISRSQFPIARKDTPQNYHRILLETLNSPLPKYSIPQRLFISPDGSNVYTFPLDKQFTLAKGGRKSIAIREARFLINNDMIPAPNNQINDQLSLDVICTINYINLNNPLVIQTININVNNSPLQILRQYPIQNFYQLLFNEISNVFNNAINNAFGTQAVNYTTLIDKTDGITFKIAAAGYSFDFESYNITIHNNNNQRYSILGIVGTETKSFSFDENTNTFTCKFPNAFDSPYSVCSTINPWSPGNIISSLNRFFPQLNKLFPYDNQQEIKLWFINQKGGHVYNHIFTGYIDLELIIDNLNNFAMDD